jgi:hypothetical protein
MSERPFYLERGFVLSTVFLGVLALVAVAVFAGGGGSRQVSTQAGPRASGAPATPGHPVVTGGSMCGLPVGNRDKPVGPPDASWRLVGSMAVPDSPQFGPGVTGPRTRRCFAHSPTGALFAAVSFLAMASRYSGDPDVMRNITAATAAQRVFLRQNSEPNDPFFRVQLQGFQVAVVTRNLVMVDLAVRSNQASSMVAITLPMRWEGGDWRAVITDVEQPYQVEPVADASDFVFWSGA